MMYDALKYALETDPNLKEQKKFWTFDDEKYKATLTWTGE